MEEALAKVGSLKFGSLLISKKTKQDISHITQDLCYSISSTIEDKAKSVLNKLKGKTQKPLSELLRDHHLPTGLFPANAICYEFDEQRSKLVVHLSSPCEVGFKDSSIVKYANRVKATLSKGKLSGVEGMTTKILVWVKVTSVFVEGYKCDKVWFTTSGGVKKSRSKDAYEIARVGIQVEEF
ncbi:hypothetical protein Cgig2_017811 [Carnegiea gigantea]|uniref:Uncharacterized protein n=1 Tax=Carnegiea gigantea TaxID=171969 RepID=A0A9Q1KYJ3_9CARY|nr:hypothetical protein Cgig2_017811 [Carnegiea gigantea]